jgi:hypothetical protein
MPLLATLFHQAWRAGEAPAAALAEAKRRFAQGDWFAATEALVREHYRPAIVECLVEAVAATDDDVLTTLTHTWPWPPRFRALRADRDGERLAELRVHAATAEGREALADAVIEALVMDRASLPESVVQTLCTWLIGYGDAH